MTASVLKELYNSPNGDRWTLGTDNAGNLVIAHHPNNASGGRPSEIDVKLFLSRSGNGPERQALVEALESLDRIPGVPQEFPLEVTEKLLRALGYAAARCWSSFPQEIQHNLFEAAVSSEGEVVRPQLAVYLHGKHERTVGTAQARAMPEPDSLGG
jgi:hypothetical protein